MTTPTPAAPGSGHPRHQIREFTVTYRRTSINQTFAARVMAQTEHDAIFRAGMLLAAQYRANPDPGRWAADFIVTGVADPAPATWTPAP